MNFWPWGKKNKKNEEEKSPVDTVRKMLAESNTGTNTLNLLEIKSLNHIFSDIDQDEKKVFLNKDISPETGALEVIGAANFFLKHDEKGEDMTNIRIIEADMETEQLVFAEEMRQKNPKILDAFKESRGNGLCDAYEQAMAKMNNPDIARSAAVDFYLSEMAPEEYFSAEELKNICKNADGKSYYIDSRPEKSPIDAVAVRNMLGESKTGIETLKQLEQSGYSIGIKSSSCFLSYMDSDEKKVFLDNELSPEEGALFVVESARVLRHEGKGVNILETKNVCRADIWTAKLAYAEEMRQKNPQILETFKKDGYGDVLSETYEQAMAETDNPDAARSAAVDYYLNQVAPEKKFLPEAFNKICTNSDGKSYYVGSKVKSSPVNAVRKTLEESKTGENALNLLKENGYSIELQSFEKRPCAVNVKTKRVLLDQDVSPEEGALFVVEAARTAKHEKDGLNTPETWKICQADILTEQLVFAEEMRQNNPKIIKIFNNEGYGRDLLSKSYEETMAKTNDTNAARSAAVDCFWHGGEPEKFSAEAVGKICTDADGKCYYVGSKTDNALSATKTNTNPAFNAALAMKAKQGR